MARRVQPRPRRGARRSWLIVPVTAALVLTAVGARAAQMTQQLHAAAATATATTAAATAAATAATARKRPGPDAATGAGDASTRPSTPVAGRTGAARQGATRQGVARQGRSTPTAGPLRTAIPSSALELAATLARLAGQLNARPGSSGSLNVAAVDLVSGRRFSYGATSAMIEASIAKLDILEALLLRYQQAGTALRERDDRLATAMIEHSDNAAGQTLWDQLGYAAGIATANRQLGLRHTVPDPAGYYGLTTSCAGDQLTLLENLQRRQGPLTPRSRTYALHLLANVEPDQRWGVPAAADPGTSFDVKDGWMPADDDTGRWIVNSDAIITAAGHRVLIAIMTRGARNEQDGIKLIEATARTVTAALHPQPR